ncbi:MAG: hypothetical protein ACLFQQ_23810 [Desulfococcaceae bacterium]
MSILQVNSTVRFEDLLKAVGQLKTDELERLMSEVVSLRAKRRAASFSEKETELLLKITTGLPPEIQNRFHELNQKRREEKLSASEHSELLELTERMEKLDSERAAYLAELAQLKGISFSKLLAKNKELNGP